MRRGAGAAAAACAAAFSLAGCAPDGQTSGAINIGAIFPLASSNQPAAGDQLLGVTIARDLVNAAGGAGGRQLRLDVRDVDTIAAARPAADSLRADGVAAVIGAYSSTLSIAASTAVSADGMVYWESGATADRLTGRGLPLVFRVGPNGADLGGNSARFAVHQLASRLHRASGSLRVLLVTAGDDYARSVAEGARASLAAAGITAIHESVYDPFAPYWPAVLATARSVQPDVVMLSSHVPDGIAFRRAFVAAGLHAPAFIGTTMAQCPPSFGSELGPAAVGVFASDRPDGPFNPQALSGPTRAVFDRFLARWRGHRGGAPSSEGIAGFSAAWALFHETLTRSRGFTAGAIATAASALDLPEGTLPDGAGIRFDHGPAQLGQNQRAAAVIEQWQTPEHLVVVWPPPYATGAIAVVPLPV